MKIKNKLIVEVAVLSVTLTIVSFLTISNTILIENNFSTLNDELIPVLTNLKDMRLVATNVLASTLEFAIIEGNASPNDNSNQELERIDTDISDQKNQFNELLSLYKKRISDPQDLKLANEIEQEWNQLGALSEKFIEYKKKGISDAAFIKLNEEFTHSKESLFVKIDSAILSNEKKVNEKRIFVSEAVSDTTIIVFVNLVVFVLLIVILRYYILISILSTISKLRKITKEIAGGNLKVKVRTTPKDEVGELLVDIERMAQDLDRIQRKLLESEKFSVIGELAARMAHDIRNPLTSIKIGVEYFRKKKDRSEGETNMFNSIDGAIDRISFQIQDVLEFIKTTPVMAEKTSLLTLLKRVTASQKFPEGLELVLPSNDLVVECDPRKIEVVFINMIRNAIDAVGPKGRIAIRFIDLEDSIKIEIEDSGPGIRPEHQDKVFEPLFTTKQRGTGLGLASVKNIVEQHRGTITFSNNPTVFSIVLPKNQVVK